MMHRPRSLQNVLSTWYQPDLQVKVGILLVGGALESRRAAVDAALSAAGHVPIRRRAELLSRVGEADLRPDDVVEFLDLYGHEYALTVIRSWSSSRSYESAIVAAARNAGSAVAWETTGSDAGDAWIAAGVDAVVVAEG